MSANQVSKIEGYALDNIEIMKSLLDSHPAQTISYKPE